MKKPEQKQINNIVKGVFDNIPGDVKDTVFAKQLYSCQAEIIRKDNIVYLRSYSTIVAVFDLESVTMYDGLRYVYGYTATSAQHIAKFRNYCREYFHLGWHDITEYRYYDIR